VLVAASVAHAATERPLALGQLLARSRLVVEGAVTEVRTFDEGRIALARVRADRVLKGAGDAADVQVVERRDLSSKPDLLRVGDAVLLFLTPAGRSSSLAAVLPAGGRYFEPLQGRQGVIAADASEVAEAAGLVARMVEATTAPSKDPAERAARHRALVFDEIAARQPRVVADGAAALPGIPDLAASLTDPERGRLSAALERTDLPGWVRVALVRGVAAAKLTALIPVLRTLPSPDAATLEASWAALRDLGAPPTAGELEAALTGPDAGARAVAARALVLTQEPGTAERVARLALSDPDDTVRVAAAEALAQAKSPTTLELLERIFAAGDTAVRQAAGRSITAIGGRPAQEAFARLAWSDRPGVPAYAVTLLLLTGIPKDDPLVVRIRTSHPIETVRHLAAEGLPKGEPHH
jgi:HEAT repeat protein